MNDLTRRIVTEHITGNGMILPPGNDAFNSGNKIKQIIFDRCLPVVVEGNRPGELVTPKAKAMLAGRHGDVCGLPAQVLEPRAKKPLRREMSLSRP